MCPEATLQGQDPIALGILGYGLDRPLAGIGRYTMEMINRFAKHDGFRTTVLAPFDTAKLDLPGNITIARLRGTRLLPAMMTAGPLELALAARNAKLDILFDPTGIGPFPRMTRLKSCIWVLTIHDAVPFVHPETQTALTRFLFKRYLPGVVTKVDALVTCSAHSKTDLARSFKGVSGHIVVIPHGVSDQFRPFDRASIDEVIGRLGLPARYLLSVGSLEPRKNLTGLFEAYTRVRQRDETVPPLVVVGKRGWKEHAIFARVKELGMSDFVIFTGHLSDSDLPLVFSGADCFVYPSLYEGFGLPPLEALASGIPVVTSNTSSLPEVVGNAALTVDPADADAIADAIMEVLSGRADIATMRERGLQRAADISWARSFQSHADLFRQLIEKGRAHG